MSGATGIMFTRKVMGLLLLSAVLHLTGYVTPGWFFIKVNRFKLHVGLWYGVTCDGEECVSDTITNLNQSHFKFKDSESVSSVMAKYQVLATTALSACLIAVLTNIVHRKTSHKLSSIWAVATCIICIFMSGILGIVTAAHFANRLRYAAKYYATFGEEDPYGVPYSIIFTGLGGLVSLINYTVVAYHVAMSRNKK